jgi:hypothetical protein
MGKIEDLAERYYRHVCVPWQRTVAGAQRVVIVVYDKELERSFRARKAEFEQRTRRQAPGSSSTARARSPSGWRPTSTATPTSSRPTTCDEARGRVPRTRDRAAHASDCAPPPRTPWWAVTGVGSLYGFAHILDDRARRRARHPRPPRRVLPWQQGRQQLPSARRARRLELPRNHGITLGRRGRCRMKIHETARSRSDAERARQWRAGAHLDDADERMPCRSCAPSSRPSSATASTATRSSASSAAT